MRNHEVELWNLWVQTFLVSLSLVSFMLCLQAPSLPGFVHQFSAVPHRAEGPGAAARGDDERSGPGPGHLTPPCVCAPLCQRCCTPCRVPAQTGRCPPTRLHNLHSTAGVRVLWWFSSLRSSDWFHNRTDYFVIVIQPVRTDFFLISNLVTF